MFRVETHVSMMSSGTVRCSSSKRLQSTTTLFTIIVLLFTPSMSHRLPMTRRNAAPSTLDYDLWEHQSYADANDDGDKLFFASGLTENADGTGSSATVRAVVGEDIVLECEAGGSPGPAIHWVRNGHRILQTSNSQSVNALDDEAHYETRPGSEHRALRLSSTRSRLYIDCVGLEDAGTYQCVADTPTKRIVSATVLEVVRKSRPHKRRHVFQLHKNSVAQDTKNGEVSSNECHRTLPGLRHQAARIYMWTVHRIELEDADVELYCRATGNPAPKITWYDRDDNKITNGDSNYRLLANGDLVIHGVTWSEHMGLFRCVANNDGGSDSATAFLYPTTE